MSEFKSNKISPATGTDVTLGDSGDTFTIPSGATIVNNGTATGFGGAAGGGILQMICHQDGVNANDSTVTGLGDTAYTSGAIWSAMTTTITPASADNYIYFSGDFGISANKSFSAHLWVTYQVSGGSEIPIQGDLGNKPVTARIENATDNSDVEAPISVSGMFAPNTTSAITVRIRTGCTGSNGGVAFHKCRGGQTDGNDGAGPMSSFVVWEVAGSVPTLTN